MAAGAGDDGESGLAQTMVAGAVREAVILAAERGGAARLAAEIEIAALAGRDATRVMAITRGLAGQSAAAARLAGADRGAETRHDEPPGSKGSR